MFLSLKSLCNNDYTLILLFLTFRSLFLMIMVGLRMILGSRFSFLLSLHNSAWEKINHFYPLLKWYLYTSSLEGPTCPASVRQAHSHIETQTIIFSNQEKSWPKCPLINHERDKLEIEIVAEIARKEMDVIFSTLSHCDGQNIYCG